MQKSTFVFEGLSERVAAWLDSGGSEQLAEAQERSRKAGEAIRKALTPDHDTLRHPMTI